MLTHAWTESDIAGTEVDNHVVERRAGTHFSFRARGAVVVAEGVALKHTSAGSEKVPVVAQNVS